MASPLSWLVRRPARLTDRLLLCSCLLLCRASSSHSDERTPTLYPGRGGETGRRWHSLEHRDGNNDDKRRLNDDDDDDEEEKRKILAKIRDYISRRRARTTAAHTQCTRHPHRALSPQCTSQVQALRAVCPQVHCYNTAGSVALCVAADEPAAAATARAAAPID